MNRFFSGLGRNVVRFRWLVVILWIAVLILSSKALPSLSSEVNNNNSQFLPATAPSEQASTLATPLLGNSNKLTQILIVAGSSHGQLTKADQAAIAREVALARGVGKVTSVRDLGSSPDREAAQLIVDARVNGFDIATQQTLVDALHATLAQARAPAGLSLHLAGPVAVNVANQASSNKAGKSTSSLSFLFIIILLLLIFRSLLAPIVTLIPPAFALVLSMRFIGGLGAHGLKVSEITELLLIVLLIGAGTDYGLFLVFRVREAVRSGMEPKEAVVHSLVRVGESISASAGTVIVALLSLLFASFGIYHDLGIPLAVGVAVMLVAGLTLLPALLAICGRALFWPAKVAPGTVTDGGWGRVAGRLVRRPALTLGIGVLVFAGLASTALGYHSGGFGGATGAPAGTDTAAGSAIIAKHFPQASANPTNLVFAYARPVWEDPAVLQRAGAVLARSRALTQLAGPLDPIGFTFTPSEYAALHAALGNPAKLPATEPPGLKVPPVAYDAYRATTLFVSANGRVVQFEASLAAGDPSTTAALNATPQIRALVAKAGAASGATANGVAGEAPALYDVASASNHDLGHIIPIAILAIALLLALVLRSLVAPLYLIVSVALSYFAALGVSVLVFIDLGGQKGLTFILPFLMFIFLLALGEDYNILVMTRIREEAAQRPLREAVVRAVGRTGPTITSAGLVLAASFGALALAGGGSGGSQVRDIGAGLAIGILMDTFLVRTLLVPSTVALLGRWNWWPSKMGQADSDSEQPLEAIPAVSAAD